MLQKKDFIKVILLSILTCNIYGIFFLYEYDRDLRQLCTHSTRVTTEYLLAFVLSIFTCGLFMYYWYYTIFVKEAEEAAATGVLFNVEDPLVMAICMVIPFFGTYLLCDNFNKLLCANS